MKIRVLPEEVSISRLPREAQFPEWGGQSRFFSVTRNGGEVTVVGETGYIPVGVQAEHGWIVLETEGPLEFHLTGVLSDILEKLSRGRISVFVLSTYSTDCILIKKEKLEYAVQLLSESHEIVRS
jgi:hypothetical protein